MIDRPTTDELLRYAIDKAARSAAPVFALNAWQYGDRDGRMYVPTEADLRVTLARLVSRAREEKGDADAGTVGSGRFEVTVYDDDYTYERVTNVRIVLEIADGMLSEQQFDEINPRQVEAWAAEAEVAS